MCVPVNGLKTVVSTCPVHAYGATRQRAETIANGVSQSHAVNERKCVEIPPLPMEPFFFCIHQEFPLRIPIYFSGPTTCWPVAWRHCAGLCPLASYPSIIKWRRRAPSRRWRACQRPYPPVAPGGREQGTVSRRTDRGFVHHPQGRRGLVLPFLKHRGWQWPGAGVHGVHVKIYDERKGKERAEQVTGGITVERQGGFGGGGFGGGFVVPAGAFAWTGRRAAHPRRGVPFLPRWIRWRRLRRRWRWPGYLLRLAEGPVRGDACRFSHGADAGGGFGVAAASAAAAATVVRAAAPRAATAAVLRAATEDRVASLAPAASAAAPRRFGGPQGGGYPGATAPPARRGRRLRRPTAAGRRLRRRLPRQRQRCPRRDGKLSGSADRLPLSGSKGRRT